MNRLLKLSRKLKEIDFLEESFNLFCLEKFAGILQDTIENFPEYEAELIQAGKKYKPKFIPWIANALNRQEDLSLIFEALDKFIRYENSLDDREINHYKSSNEILNKISILEKSKTQDRKKEEQNLEGQYQVIYESERFKVYCPYTRGASCFLGKGTKWCTSANNKNLFNEYSMQNNFLYYIFSLGVSRENSMYKIGIMINKFYESELDELVEEDDQLNLEDSFMECYDAENTMITIGDIKSHLSSEFNQIFKLMGDHIKSFEMSPHKKKIKSLNFEDFLLSLNDIEDLKEKESFLYSVLESSDDNLMEKIIAKYLELSKKQDLDDEKDFDLIEKAIIHYIYLPKHIYMASVNESLTKLNQRLFEESNLNKNAKNTILSKLRLPEDFLKKMSLMAIQNENFEFKILLASNPYVSLESLDAFIKSEANSNEHLMELMQIIKYSNYSYIKLKELNELIAKINFYISLIK